MTITLAPVHGLRGIIAAFVLAMGLAGCNATDPYLRSDVWRPAGVNDMNIEAQIANAADLRKGRSSETVDGDTAGAPVDRLRRDKPRALPQSGVTSVGTAGGTGSTN